MGNSLWETRCWKPAVGNLLLVETRCRKPTLAKAALATTTHQSKEASVNVAQGTWSASGQSCTSFGKQIIARCLTGEGGLWMECKQRAESIKN